MAPTRPSIMSDGAMMSQPASACTSACRTSTATVSSLRMRPSSISPSWPWLVKGSSATSQSTPRSGNSFLIARTDLHTRLSGLSGLRTVLVAQGRLGIGKQRDAGDVQLHRALGVAHRLVDAEPLDAGHRGDRRALVVAVDHEQRPDQIVRGQDVFPHQPARPFRLAVAARADRQIERQGRRARLRARGVSRISIGRPNLIAM